MEVNIQANVTAHGNLFWFMEKAKFYAHNLKMNSQLLYDPNNLIFRIQRKCSI